MCEPITKQILFQQCRYLYTRFDEPQTAISYQYTMATYFVYVELRQIGSDIIIENVTKLDGKETTFKRRVFPFGTQEYEAIRKAINVYDKISLDIDALYLKFQQEEQPA